MLVKLKCKLLDDRESKINVDIKLDQKQDVLKLRSNNNIVIAPAKTDRDKINKITVMEIVIVKVN